MPPYQLDTIAIDLEAGHAHPVLPVGDNGQTMLVCGIDHRMDVGLADAIVALPGKPALLIWRQIAEVVGPRRNTPLPLPRPCGYRESTFASGPRE